MIAVSVSQSSPSVAEGPNPPAESAPADADEVPALPPDQRPAKQPGGLPPSKATHEFNVLCYTLLSFFILSFGVWAVFAWIDYGKRYAPLAEGFYAGGTRSIEITLVRDDVNNLDCASDLTLDGVHCAYKANEQPFDPNATPDPVRLRPYNTADNVLFLGSGLWSSPGMAGPLPSERFSVTCNYRMVSAIKSVALRWAPGGAFAPVKSAVPAGVLSDCVIPR
jgi:hypothetical protein